MTVDTTEFTPEISEYIDEAYARCGVEYRTAYQLKSAIRSLNFILADWANRGLNRWTIEQKTLTLVANDNTYSNAFPENDTYKQCRRKQTKRCDC